MGEVFITLKVMPTSPEVKAKDLKEKVKAKAEEIEAKVFELKEEPIAFGLVAVIITIIWKEDKNPDIIETELAKIKDVNSVQVIDLRRAII